MMDSYEQSKINTKRYRKIKKLLQMVYGYDSFRLRQYEVINKLISGYDVCGVFPTGHGKSICFQIPAIYLDKPAIIISPLISLMEDQQIILSNLGLSSCCYNSTIDDKKTVRHDILKGKYQFIYITPESIINMKDFLVKLVSKQGISLIAIDEAHCISSYGFYFRKAYRELTILKEILPDIPILAVTATATTLVGKDICKVLRLRTDEPIKTSFDRPNLYIEIHKKGSRVDHDIIPLLKKHRNESVIIYCLKKRETQEIADILQINNIESEVYHADIPHEKKQSAHKKFLNDECKIIVATIAFGMGINKPNVRVVIHYGSPKNIEGYYQEIGRAGRDGNESYCYAFYNFRDFKIQESFIQNIDNVHHRNNQLDLLAKMKRFMTSDKCRRLELLAYFDEKAPGQCKKCDNCCIEKVTPSIKPIQSATQNIQKEAKLLIDTIDGLGKNFGITMYINILRGSNNKNMTSIMKKSDYYGAGKHRSVAWWKELAEKLIELQYLQYIYLKGGQFAMQVIKVTQSGSMWASMTGLQLIFGGSNPVLDKIPMKTLI